MAVAIVDASEIRLANEHKCGVIGGLAAPVPATEANLHFPTRGRGYSAVVAGGGGWEGTHSGHDGGSVGGTDAVEFLDFEHCYGFQCIV